MFTKVPEFSGNNLIKCDKVANFNFTPLTGRIYEKAGYVKKPIDIQPKWWLGRNHIFPI
jgi:hypothetical protein